MGPMENFVEWLRERGIPERTISHIIAENIDPSCIVIMEDQELKELFPKSGDRVTILNFCRREIAPKKQSLINKLKVKIEEKNGIVSSPDDSRKFSTGRSGKKATRMIELGWMYAVENEEFRYVRKIRGGGTRRIPVSRTAKPVEVKEKAIDIFFPNGHSPRGNISEFSSVELVDFKLNDLDEKLTVDQYFDITGLSTLRFYLATRRFPESGSDQDTSRSRPKRRQSGSNDEDASDAALTTEPHLCQNFGHEYPFRSMDVDDEQDFNMPFSNPEDLTRSNDPDELTRLVNSILDENNVFHDQENLAAPSTFVPQNVQSIPDAPTNVLTLLTDLQRKIECQNLTKINVYRKDIFGCCLRALRRKNFNPFNKIMVNFTDIDEKSEGAIDEGGPTRELFRLLLNYLQESSLFVGEESKYISFNSSALHENHYFEAGRILSLSLVHGGSGPHFFSDTLYSLLVDNGLEKTTISIPIEDMEHEIKAKLQKFEQEADLGKLQDLIVSDTIFSTAGCQFISKLEDKERILKDTLQFYGYFRIAEPLNQLISGLKTCGIFDEMVKRPELFKPLFCQKKKSLTADEVEKMFKLIEYSPSGCNKREIENRTICFFNDYLEECQDGDGPVRLENFFVFLTGADSMPPLGFPSTPTISFLDDESMFPTVSTCSIELRLPTKHNRYEDFKEKMDFAVLNSEAFGSA